MSVISASWLDAASDEPLQTAATFAVLAAATVAVGLALRALTRRSRSLRQQVLAITFASLVVAAGAALALARLMVLDRDQLADVVGVLAVTAVFAGVLAVVASETLGRDARRIEHTLRRIESGDRAVRSGVVRSDELGHVAHALDQLTTRLDELELERESYETERTAMLSSVGHDLRTPLSALRAALEAVTDGVAPDPERYLRSMQRDVEAITALVDDLFLLARIEAGRLELRPESVDLAEIADDAAEALAPTAEQRGIRIVQPVAEPVPVAGNATALGRVIRNLLDNAIRHAPNGSTIELRVATVDGRASVQVVDEGPGFPEEFTDQAFDRFARAEPSRNRTTGGAGLGLAIARGLIEAHGGRIWIEQPPGGRVAFSLPAA